MVRMKNLSSLFFVSPPIFLKIEPYLWWIGRNFAAG
jgi:hypothetical protein